ncbi:MAG: glycosyltransferase family 39 protein [Thiohalophilus sp.]|jgi:hypothetical protein
MMQQYITGMLSNRICFSQTDSRCYRGIFLLILLTGLVLRLGAIYFAQGYHHFMVNDEVSALRFILAWLAGDEQTHYLAQPAFNDGHLPGPLWTLLGVVLFKLGGNSAEGALYLMAALNSLTVWLVYKLARNYFEPALALLTAALYAIAPWTVYYSYGLYNPVPLDLIGALLFLALWQCMTRESTRWVFWVPVLCAVIPQFHMIGLFVIPAVLLVLALSPARLNSRWLVAGILAGLLLYLPYLIGDMQNNWHNLHAMLSGSQKGEYSASVLKILTAPATLLSSAPAGWTGDGMEPLREFGNRWFGHYSVLVVLAGWTLLHAFFYLFSALKKLVVLIWRQRGRLRAGTSINSPLMFIGLLVFVPLLLFLLTGHNFSTRYAIILLPLLFLLPGLFLTSLKREGIKSYWVVSLALTGVLNLYLLGSYFAYQQQRLVDGSEFMPSFRTLESIRQNLQTDAGKEAAFRVDISPALKQNLSHFDYKLVATISQYVRIWQIYHQGRHGTPDVSYIIELADADSEQPALYRRGNIVIHRQADKPGSGS